MKGSVIHAKLRDLILRRIDQGATPGAVLILGTSDQILFHEAFGLASVPDQRPVQETTLYDLASLTKCVATAPSILCLREDGRLNLEDPLSRHIQEWSSCPGFERITIRQCLTHWSGLCPMVPTDVAEQGMPRVIDWVGQHGIQKAPDAGFIYSDVNYILLCEVIRRLSGRGLEAFARERIFFPLGMQDTGFLPSEEKRSRCAATFDETGMPPLGVVHDPAARALGGVAGHAGVFSMSADLARFARLLLKGGELDGRRILSPESVQLMTSIQSPSERLDWRGLGWDIWTSYSAPKGELLSPGSYGHTGFTGTSMWIDPDRDGFIVLLTNRTHVKGDVVALRRAVANAASFLFRPARSGKKRPRVAGAVLPGIDVLAQEKFGPLKRMSVGLITHGPAIDAQGVSTLDVFRAQRSFRLKRIFTPEHGFEARAEGPISDAQEEEIPVISLYGERKKPTPDLMEGLDILVCDLQDIGARFYTYLTTMGYGMEAAAEAGIPYMVLDRPNPVTGLYPEGPVLEPGLESFVGYGQIPIRHSMTLGELAEWFKREGGRISESQNLRISRDQKIREMDLRVIRAQGWRRFLWFDETGLLWRNPSPNMRSLSAGLLYPGLCLLERTPVSVGRGTDLPFEQIGAPWIQGGELAARLNGLDLPGLVFHPATFVPEADPFRGEGCQGVRVEVTCRDDVRPVAMGIHLFRLLTGLWPDSFQPGEVDAIAGVKDFSERVKRAENSEGLMETWVPALVEFLDARMSVLMY